MSTNATDGVSESASRLVAVPASSRPGPPIVLAFLAGMTILLKAFRMELFGLSLYSTYVIALFVAVRYWQPVLERLRTWFLVPGLVLVAFAAWGVARGAGLTGPTVTLGKIVVAFGVAAIFGVVTTRAEKWLYRGLLSGVLLSVFYMAYQWVSSVFFEFGLPFTASARWAIGLGLSSRYGIARVTGFTEEPSFIATLLVGATLLNIAYAYRRSKPTFLRVSVVAGAVGLAMCTSNNLFATAIIVAAFWPFIRNRRLMLLFLTYYAVVIVITPFVLLRDITYFARFSAYDIFLRSGPVEQLLGRGLGAYDSYFAANNVQFGGQDVASLASVWGAWLFEGGVILAALVVWWLARVVRGAGWREGLALVALLLMLSNYNSPWWPIVSLALAECLTDRRKQDAWKTNSISVATQQH